MTWHKAGAASVKTPHVSIPKPTMPKPPKVHEAKVAKPHVPKAATHHHTKKVGKG